MWRSRSVTGLFPRLTLITALIPGLRMAIAMLLTFPVVAASGFIWLFKVF